ncbi:MAG TPA: hypothetical protein VNI54_00920 [Thermoanaerobaculia bacterium]|nr:hypothetical protein [Thermoanaerobaculia bacterium]
MKTLALLLAFLAADDTLVDAAKDAKEKRKKSTTKVITNADVKKSKGRIATTPNVTAEPVKPEPTLMEKHTAAKTAERALAEKRAASDATIAALEKELAAIEQQYYNENDLNRRDTEIVTRFNDVKARLDAAPPQP